MTQTQSEMTEANPLVDFTDADLKASMRRAMRFTAIFTVIGALVLGFAAGWQTGALFVAGAIVSLTGLYEWQQLIDFINAKLDNQTPPRATGFILTMFILRLGIAGLIIYASLRCLHGSLYALLGGLGLAVIALTIEAIRLLRS
jgi:ATP synthase I chain